MIKYIYDYLFKKIKFSDDLMSKMDILNQINWCSHVGKIDLSIQLPYKITWCNEKEVIYYLGFNRNKKGITCLENLFNLNSNILSGYISTHYNHILNTEWNRVVDKTNKFANYSRVKSAQNQFNKDFNTSVNLHLENFIRLYMLTAYFYEIDKNLPNLFLFDILNIYSQGHIIVGWNGNKPLNNSGSLLVF